MSELQQMASGIGIGAWSVITKFHELASARAHVPISVLPRAADLWLHASFERLQRFNSCSFRKEFSSGGTALFDPA